MFIKHLRIHLISLYYRTLRMRNNKDMAVCCFSYSMLIYMFTALGLTSKPTLWTLKTVKSNEQLCITCASRMIDKQYYKSARIKSPECDAWTIEK